MRSTVHESVKDSDIPQMYVVVVQYQLCNYGLQDRLTQRVLLVPCHGISECGLSSVQALVTLDFLLVTVTLLLAAD